MDLVEIDVSDDTALRDWFAVEAAGIAHDRPQAVSRTYQALVHQVRQPSAYRRVVLLAARDGGEIVGIADLGLPLQDNTHLGGLEITVHPGHRRRGIATALYAEADRHRRAEGRTSLVGEVHVPVDQADTASPGWSFGRALGFASVHVEEHLVLALPLDTEAVGRLGERVAAAGADYEILTWGDRCPDELVGSFCEMKTRMDDDVPLGEVDHTPVVHTEERLRVQEERTARSYTQVVSAARRRSDGVLGGYSQVFLAHGTDQAWQDDTLVMPAHRGRRLGTALKLATLDILHRDHPERRTLHTWTDPDNQAMYLTNIGFGFAPVERMHEMQRRDG